MRPKERIQSEFYDACSLCMRVCVVHVESSTPLTDLLVWVRAIELSQNEETLFATGNAFKKRWIIAHFTEIIYFLIIISFYDWDVNDLPKVSGNGSIASATLNFETISASKSCSYFGVLTTSEVVSLLLSRLCWCAYPIYKCLLHQNRTHHARTTRRWTRDPLFFFFFTRLLFFFAHFALRTGCVWECISVVLCVCVWKQCKITHTVKRIFGCFLRYWRKQFSLRLECNLRTTNEYTAPDSNKYATGMRRSERRGKEGQCGGSTY